MVNRRQFLKGSGVFSVSIPILGGSTLLSQAYAAEWKALDRSSNPQAKSLAYYADVKDYIKKGDSKEDKNITPDKLAKAKDKSVKARCENCTLYGKIPGHKRKIDGVEYDSCSIFPNKVVSSQGMCNTWAPMA